MFRCQLSKTSQRTSPFPLLVSLNTKQKNEMINGPVVQETKWINFGENSNHSYKMRQFFFSTSEVTLFGQFLQVFFYFKTETSQAVQHLTISTGFPETKHRQVSN